jgi:hypothetical protein
MSITQEYVKRAEECERLAGACIAESNRNILLFAAASWRTMAEDASAGTVPAACRTRMPTQRKASAGWASNASVCRLPASQRNYLRDGTLRAHASTHGVEQRK